MARVSHTERGLRAGTVYRTYVRAVNPSGASAWTSVLRTRTPRPVAANAPGAVTNFSARPSTTSIDFMWDATATASGYDLYITTSLVAPTAQTTPTASVGAVTAYTHTGLNDNTSYRTYIRATNSAGNGQWSFSASVRTLLAAPGVPPNFRNTGATDSSLVFSWGRLGRATGYDLYFSTTDTPPVDSTQPTDSVGAVTTYTRTGLTADTTYRAYVRATNSGGRSAWSAAVSASTSGTAPAVPADLSVTATAYNTLSITWSRTPRAAGYDLYIDTSATAPGESTAPTVTGIMATTYTRTLLAANTTYRVYVRATNLSGNSAWSSAASATTPVRPTQVPQTPTGIGITTRTTSSLTYGWTATQDAASYDIYISTSNVAPTPQTAVTAMVGAVTTYTQSNLEDGTFYYFFIRAKNALGESAWSSGTSAATHSISVPNAISDLTASAKTKTSITYTWTQITGGAQVGATGYDLYFSTAATAPTALTAATVSVGTVGTYTRTGLTAGVTYYAYIRSKNTAGQSAWTPAVVTRTTRNAPDTPQNLVVTATGSATITYQWTAVDETDSYELYVATSSAAPTAQTAATAQVRNATYTATALLSDTTYYAYVRARNDGGASDWSVGVTATTALALGVPANFSNTATTATSIAYSWSAVERAQTYDFYITTSATAPTTDTTATRNLAAFERNALGVVVPNTSYTRTGLTRLTKYYSYLRARNSEGVGAWTSALEVTTSDLIPNRPAAPTSSSATDTTVTVGWAASARATGYDLYITTGAVPTNATTPTASVGAVTTYTFTGLTPRTAYRIYLRAKNSAGASLWSDVRHQSTTLAALTIPTGLSGTWERTGIRYTWDANPANQGSVGYDVFWTESDFRFPSAGTTPLATVQPGGVRTAFEPDTRYDAVTHVFVRAWRGTGRNRVQTDWSSEYTVRAAPAVPAAPTGLTSSGIAYNSVTLSWTASARALSYRVLIREATRTAPTAQTSGGRSTTETTITRPVGANTNYHAYVRAENARGNSTWTAAHAFTTPQIPAPPVPAHFAANVVNDTSITYAWTPAARVSGYDLYFSTTATAPTAETEPTTRQTASLGAVTYTRTMLTAGTQYYAYIRARNAGGNSAWSAAVTATTLEIPTGLTGAVRTYDTLSYDWSAVSSALGYEVYVSASDTAPASDDVVLPNSNQSYQITSTGQLFRSTSSRTLGHPGVFSDGSGILVVNNVVVGTFLWDDLQDVIQDASGRSGPVDLTVGADTAVSITGFDGVVHYLGYSHGGTGPLIYYGRSEGTGLYNIELRRTGVLPNQLDYLGATDTGYEKTSLLELTTYYAWIRSRHGAGKSGWSASIFTVTSQRSGTLAAPTGFGRQSSTASAITYSWNGVTGATGYDLAIRGFSGRGTPNVFVGTVTSATYSVPADAPVQWAYLRAVNTMTASDWIGPVIASVGTETTAPQFAPANLRFTQNNFGGFGGNWQYTVAWDAVADATSYDYYSGDSASAAVPEHFQNTAALNISVRGGTPGTRYLFVRARNAAGTGPWAAPFHLIAAPHQTPGGITAQARWNTSRSLYGVAMSWNAVQYATGYDVYVADNSTPPTADTVPQRMNNVRTSIVILGNYAPSSTFYAYVRARSSAGVAPWSSAVTFTTGAVPPTAAPTNFAATALTFNSIRFTWTAVTGATGYDVYVNSGTLPDAAALNAGATDVGNVTTWTIRGFGAGNTAYHAYIRAKNSGGDGPWSSVIRVTTPVRPLEAPPVPTGLARSSATGTQIVYTWNAAARATGYDIYVSATNTAPTAQTTPTASIGSTTYTRTGLTLSTTYYAWVRAKNSAGASAWSAVFSTATTRIILPAPANLRVTSSRTDTAAGRISLAWDRVDGGTEYQIYRSTFEHSTPVIHNALWQAGTTDTGTQYGTTATTYFYVIATNRDRTGLSEWSSALAVDPDSLPAAPAGATNWASSENTYDTITYTWTAAANATGYDIYVTDSATAPTAETTPTARLGPVTTYTATGLTASTQYRAYIRATGTGGWSAWSSAVSVTTSAAPTLPVPTTLRLTTATASSLGLGWDAITGATGYDFYFSTVHHPEPTGQTVPTVSVGAVTTYTRTSLEANQVYNIWMRAKRGSATSGWSSTFEFSTEPAGLSAPATPDDSAFSDFEVSSGNSTSVSVNVPFVNNVWFYDIYITTSATAPTSGTTPTTTLAYQGGQGRNDYIATGLMPSTTYRVYLRARNSMGTSTWAMKSVTTLAVIAAPAVPTISSHEVIVSRGRRRAVRFTWATAARASRYDIYIVSRGGTAPTGSTVPTIARARGTTAQTSNREFFNSGFNYDAYIRAENYDGEKSAWSSVYQYTA